MTLPIHFELWDELECNSGVRQAVFASVFSSTWTQDIKGGDDLTLRVDRQDPMFSLVQEESIVRVQYASTFDEFRIQDISEVQGEELRADITCEGIIMDLLTRGAMLERIEATGEPAMHFEIDSRPPTEHVDIILGAFAPFSSGAPAYFAKGTIDPTNVVNMIYDWDTAHSAFQQLAAVTNSEFWVRRNGVTNYLIDIVTQIGAGGDKPLFSVPRNIISIQHTSSSKDQATRLYPRGGVVDEVAATIAENGFIVDVVAGDDLTLNEDVVTEDDQWNGFWILEQDGTVLDITDSTAPNIITVPGHSSAVADIVTFVRNAAGDRLTFVDLPSAIATYGIKSKVLDRSDIPGINNFAWNGFFNDWTQGGFGPDPCFPTFAPPVVTPPAGASNCITRQAVGLVYRADFSGAESELLSPVGWVHRVESTRAINNQAALDILNGNLGLSLSASNFGIYIQEGQQAANISLPGAVISIVGFSSEWVIEADLDNFGGVGACAANSIVAQWQGPDNFYQAYLALISGTIRAQIWKKVGGSFTQIGATFDTGLTSGSCDVSRKIKFVVGPSLQELYIDGVLRVSGTDSTFSGVKGFSGILCEDDVDTATNRGPNFDSFNSAQGANEIVMTGLPVDWTIEACGLSPATADANGRAVLDLAASDMECSTITVKDDVAAVQDTFTPGAFGLFPGDRLVWSCDDANPGISPDLNRTAGGHVYTEKFDTFQCPSLATSCFTKYPPGFPQISFTQQINCISPFTGNVEWTGSAIGSTVGRMYHCGQKPALLIQSTIQSRTNIQAEPGVGKIGFTGSNPGDGYEAYISDATSGTLHLARLDTRVRTSLGTDTTWTFSADTDYVIQLFVTASVQEARLWQAGSIVATVSATDATYSGASLVGAFLHTAGTATTDKSRHGNIHIDSDKDIVVTNMPSGHTAQVRDDTDAVVASAAESGGTATIDMLGATEPQDLNWNGAVAEVHLNAWRAVTVVTGGGVEVSRYQGIIHPGDTFDVGS